MRHIQRPASAGLSHSKSSIILSLKNRPKCRLIFRGGGLINQALTAYREDLQGELRDCEYDTMSI